MNTQERNNKTEFDTAAPVQHRLNVFLWHLRELGGVRKNDNRFVSVKELSQDTENNFV